MEESKEAGKGRKEKEGNRKTCKTEKLDGRRNEGSNRGKVKSMD